MYWLFVPFKFVNWLFEQQNQESKLGDLAKRCLNNDAFPIKAKLFAEVLEYFESNGFTKEDIETLLEAWNEFRKLGKVKVMPINQLRSRLYEHDFPNLK